MSKNTHLGDLCKRSTVGKYVGDWLEYCLKAEAEYDHHPSPFVLKFREIKQQQASQVDRGSISNCRFQKLLPFILLDIVRCFIIFEIQLFNFYERTFN